MVSAGFAFSQATVSLDATRKYQTIEGFGGFGAKKVWWESAPYHDAGYLNQIIDNLGATFFRTQIYWDGEPVNDNNDPGVINPSGFNFGPSSDNGKQFPFLRDLHEKGAKLIATVWTPPIWMKLLDIPERIPQQCYNCTQCAPGSPGRAMCGGRLNPEHYDEFAEYLVAYVRVLKQETGIDLYAISIQNEPFFANPFESNVVMPDEYADILKAVATRFKAEGLTTKFFGPEHMAEWSWGWQQKYVQEILGDPEVKPHLDIYAVHSYVDGVAADYGSAEGWTQLHQNITIAHGKPLWMTETSDFNKQGYQLGFSMARSLYLGLKFGHISGWVYWALADAVISENQLTPLGYSFKNFYKFIKPGTQRIEATSSNANILTVAFRHPDSGELTVILINQGQTAVSVSLNIPVEHGPLTLYRTSASESCKEIGLLSANQVTLSPESISTVTTIAGSGVVSIKKSEERTLTVYPNPSKGIIVIESRSSTRAAYEVSDPLGKTVLKGSVGQEKSAEVDTNGWKKGVYILRVTNGPQTLQEKIIIE